MQCVVFYKHCFLFTFPFFSQNIFLLFPFSPFFFFQLRFPTGCTAGVALFNDFYNNDLAPKSMKGLKEWRTDFFLQRTQQATELECDLAFPSNVQYSNYSEFFFNAIAADGGSATFSRVQSETGGYSYLEADSADRCNAALPRINTLLAHLSNVFSTGGGDGDNDGGGGPVATPVMKCSSSRVSTEQSSRTCILVTVCPHPAFCLYCVHRFASLPGPCSCSYWRMLLLSSRTLVPCACCLFCCVGIAFRPYAGCWVPKLTLHAFRG